MWISAGVALAMMSLVATLIVTQAHERPDRSMRKSTETILFSAILALMVLFGTAMTLLLVGGLRFLWFAKASLLLMGAFAVVCIAFSIMRGLRRGNGSHRG